jgi:hypothetical protein
VWLPSPGTLEEDPNPLEEWISDPGWPPGTSVGVVLPLAPPEAPPEEPPLPPPGPEPPLAAPSAAAVPDPLPEEPPLPPPEFECGAASWRALSRGMEYTTPAGLFAVGSVAWTAPAPA